MNATTGSETAALLAPFHHPHLVCAGPGRREGETQYTWKPFTGREPEPRLPVDAEELLADDGMSYAQYRVLENEYHSARVMWSRARFTEQARARAVKAAPVWEAYAERRGEMDALFAAFRETADGKWRAQIMRLTEAHRAARAAAVAWDEECRALAELVHEHQQAAGYSEALRLDEVVPDLDIRAWQVSSHEEYQEYGWHSCLLASGVEEAIEEQRERLREIAALTADC
jgi:hypothetical protein